MRLSTDAERDESLALETIAAAVDAGIGVFDTAHAYAHGAEELGHNERLVAAGLRRAGAASTARLVTKGGMSRPGGGWVADGRAKAIRADCEASLEALDGVPIDLYLIHAPDPRTPWQTTVRALARLVDDGLVRHVGISNVTRRQLDEALELAPIAAVEVAINPFDDRAIRGGVLQRCVETGIAVIAHSPFGGPGRAGRLEAAARARRRGQGHRRDPGRGGPHVAARALAGRHRDPGRPPAGECPLRGEGCGARARRPPARNACRCARPGDAASRAAARHA